MELAVDNPVNAPLLGQHINLDAEPDFVQQKKISALIYLAAAGRNLGLLTPAVLNDTMTPRTMVLVRPNQSRARVNIETLRYSGAAVAKSPTSYKIDQLTSTNINVYRYEVADVLMNVLLHGIAPIDTGTDFAEHLVPRTPYLCMQVPTQWGQVLVEATIAIARAHAESHRPVKILAQPGGSRVTVFSAPWPLDDNFVHIFAHDRLRIALTLGEKLHRGFLFCPRYSDLIDFE
jgi:hypothetical protein